jgi:multidrug efflux pump
VRFRLEKDADTAAAEVRDRVSRVRNKLPQAIDEPVIAKVEADAFPVMWLAFSSDTRAPLEINDLLNRIVKARLQTVTGVADVRIYGERKYAMRVWLDADRLAAYRLTTQDVEDAIRRNNLELPAGRIESSQREFSVTSQTDLVTPAEFAAVVVKTVNGFPVRIATWAGGGRRGRRAQCGAPERPALDLGRRDPPGHGQPAGAVQGRARTAAALQQDLPDDVKVDIASDNSVFIDRAVKSVYATIAEAIVLVALVIFVFCARCAPPSFPSSPSRSA